MPGLGNTATESGEVPIDRDCTGGSVDRGNAVMLLNELRHALLRLLEHDEETVIDLARLPLGRVDDMFLNQVLGRGEIDAAVRAMGDSSVEETLFPGIWRITHRDEHGRTQARFLAVCWVPELLRAQPPDVEDGARRLAEAIGDRGSQETPISEVGL